MTVLFWILRRSKQLSKLFYHLFVLRNKIQDVFLFLSYWSGPFPSKKCTLQRINKMNLFIAKQWFLEYLIVEIWVSHFNDMSGLLFMFSIFLLCKLLCCGNITIELKYPTNWKLNEILNLKWFPGSILYYIAVLL